MSQPEIKFVLNFPGLSDVEKLVWITLAALAAQNPDFTSQYSLFQFAKLLGKKPKRILRACQHLEAMGIIQQPRLGVSEIKKIHPASYGHTPVRRPLLINLLPKKAARQSIFNFLHCFIKRERRKSFDEVIDNGIKNQMEIT